MSAGPPNLNDWYTRQGLQVKGGGLTLNKGGAIKGGQTAYNTGVGFFLGYQTSTYKFSIGDPAGNRLTWDGSTLNIVGSLSVGSAVPWTTVTGGTKPADNADVTLTAINGGLTVTGGGITLSSGGSIKGGQSGYDTGTGFFLGYSSGYKFSIGNSAGDKLTWDGSSLGIVGQITGGTIKIGSGHTLGSAAFEITGSGVAYIDSLFGGILRGDNTYVSTSQAVYGNTTQNIEGIRGNVDSANAGGAAHGVRGWNANQVILGVRGTGGVVGAANGYDFYADGAGTNYGPFTGTHDALARKPSSGWAAGDIVVDVACVSRNGISNTIFEVTKSTTANQRGVIGVVCSDPVPLDDAYPPAAFITSMEDDVNKNLKPVQAASYANAKVQYNRVAVNGLGEGQMNVCGQGGDIALGDFIVASNLPGKGMKQADDILHSYTVARARESVTFAGPGQVKQVACIHLCG